MKHNTMLTVASLLSLLLPDASHYGRHRSWDIEGRELKHCAAGPRGLLYGTLVLPERRSGHVIILLVGLMAAAMPVIHMRGAHYGEIAKSPGGLFFVWVLWALGGLGGFTLILSARELWDLRRRRPQ
jgi:hypothetical protein